MQPVHPSSLIPSDLKDLHPHPQTPWNMSQALFGRARVQLYSKHGPFRTCEVLRTDPEFAFIMKYFEHQKPSGFGIKKITCIHNPEQSAAFEASIKVIEREAFSPYFAPRWHEEALPEERKQAIGRWEKQVEQFSPLEIQSPTLRPDRFFKAKVLPLWHSSTKSKCHSIYSSGFASFGKQPPQEEAKGISMDKECYGSGIYFTNSAQYAAMHSSEGYLILAWVSMREPFPVVSDVPYPHRCKDMEKLGGKEKYLNYNAHYIPVASTNPSDPHSMNYFPCCKDQPAAWDEFVVFEKAQTVARFCVELFVDFPKPLPVAASLTAESEFQLGTNHYYGREVEQNYKEAIKHFHSAADKGHVQAQSYLGVCYASGQGVSQDYEAAAKWYRLAAGQGHANAQFNLGRCYSDAQGVPQDFKEAVKWYRSAAGQGHASAQYYLGVCYENGRGVSRDFEEAVKWYRLAVDQRYASAQFNLGLCFVCGHGVPQDFTEAAKWFRLAADHGHAAAQYTLGVCYEDGQGVAQNDEEALKWFQKAAAQGDEGARDWLKKLSK